MELMQHKNIVTTLRYYVGANARRTAQTIWAAFQQQGVVAPGEAVVETPRNRTGNSDLHDGEETTRPGVPLTPLVLLGKNATCQTARRARRRAGRILPSLA
jgi:hypothetical protein